MSYLAYSDWCPHRSHVQNPHCPNQVPKSRDSYKLKLKWITNTVKKYLHYNKYLI